MGVLAQTPLGDWLQSLDFFGWVFLRRRKRLFTDQVLKRPADHLNPSLHWGRPAQVPGATAPTSYKLAFSTSPATSLTWP
jgi:hypothetical protein